MRNYKSHFFKLLRLVVIGLIVLGSVMPVQSGSANNQITPKELFTNLPGDIGWRSGFFANGLNNIASAVAIDGSRVYVGGSFTVAGNTIANRVAMWDGIAWHALGSGMDDPVVALAVDGLGNLYAGGYFTKADGKPANGVARWNGQEWESIGSGLSNGSIVSAIAIDNVGNVYIGFGPAGGNVGHGIARWDGTSWHSMGEFNIVGGGVNALLFDRSGFLYAGGNFIFGSGSPSNYLARWDGMQWNALGAGIEGDLYSTRISALASDSRGNIFAGGMFSSAGGQSVANLARWDGDDWSPVGGNADGVFTGYVRAILADRSNLYVSGDLTALPKDKPQPKVSKWDGSNWQDLNGGVSPVVMNFAIDRDGSIFAVGFSAIAGSTNANYVAEWDGAKWSQLGVDHSVSSPIFTMASDRHGGVYVGGSFTWAGGSTVNSIANWDGSSWSGLGDGLTGGTSKIKVAALALDSQGNLYAGGGFTQAGGEAANYIARWNGSIWEALADGVNGDVNSLAFDSKDNLYVGGSFDHAGSIAAYHVAKWTGKQWEALGGGIDAGVLSLAIDGEDRLIAGGYFSSANGVEAHGLARWNGSGWESLSSDIYFSASRLLYSQGMLFIIENGSLLTLRDGIFKFLGDRFGFTDNSQKPFAITMAIDERGNLIVGGNFDRAGNTPTNYIARWNGVYWENLGMGMDNDVMALAVGSGGRLFVGGIFNLAGGKVSSYFAQWDEPFYQRLPMVSK